MHGEELESIAARFLEADSPKMDVRPASTRPQHRPSQQRAEALTKARARWSAPGTLGIFAPEVTPSTKCLDICGLRHFARWGAGNTTNLPSQSHSHRMRQPQHCIIAEAVKNGGDFATVCRSERARAKSQEPTEGL